MKRKTVKILGIAASVVIIAGIVFNSCRKSKPTFTIETVIVKRGTVSNSVTATGTLQAIKTVDVGTQVSGVIKKLYVDFNSNVKSGQLLAELDKTPLIASIDDAKASLFDAQAEMSYQTSNFNRVKALYDKQLVAQNDYDMALYNYSKAIANLKMAQVRFDKAR